MTDIPSSTPTPGQSRTSTTITAPLLASWQPGSTTPIVFDRLTLIPAPNSFAGPTTLTLKVQQSPPAIPANLTLPYTFSVTAQAADGSAITKLNAPVQFSLTFADMTPDQWGNTYVNLYYFDTTTNQWTTALPFQTDMVGQAISASVSHFTDYGFGGDAIANPSTPPNLEGYQVDLCTGFAQTQIQLKVPPGTAGLTPQLQLRYSSGTIDTMNASWIPDGNNVINENTRTRLQASMVGLGWSFSLGAVYRSKQSDAAGNAIFYLLLNGSTYQLTYVDGTTYRANPDQYMRIRRLTGAPNDSVNHEYWVVETKDGTQYRYGWNTDSEQRDGKWNEAGLRVAWQWSLDQILDLSGNSVAISYSEVSVVPNNGDTTDVYDQAAYPYQINYTANAGQSFAANRLITFFYADRTDYGTHSGYTYTQFYLKKCLDHIDMSVGGTLVCSYYFTYSSSSAPYWHLNRSTSPPPPGSVGTPLQQPGLAKLCLIGLVEKDGNGVALPATTFTYYGGQIPSTTEYYKLQLHQVANGYGGIVSYSYIGHDPDGSSPLPRWYRVTQKQVDPGVGAPTDGVSGTIVKNYTYGTSYVAISSYDYRGHDLVTVADTQVPPNYEKSFFYTRDAVNGRTSLDASILQSHCYQFERWLGGAAGFTFQRKTDWSWLKTADDGGSLQSYFLSTANVYEYQGNGSRRTNYLYDSYGNQTQVNEYLTAAAPTWDRQHVFGFNFTATTSPSTGKYIVGKRSYTNLNKSDSTLVRSTWYCYDGSNWYGTAIGSGQTGDNSSYRGLLTCVRNIAPGTNLARDVVFAYDAFGNKTSITEYNSYGSTANPGGVIASANPRQTTCAYETTYHTFPQTITNPLSQVESRIYDAKWGAPTQITDVNNGVTNYTFDTYGRLTQVQGPSMTGPGGAYRRATLYTYTNPVTTSPGGRTTTLLKIQVRTDLGGTATYLTTRRYFDGIGRVVQEYTDGYANVNVVNTYYEGRGPKRKASVSHVVTGAGDTFLETDWVNQSTVTTSWTYDELVRQRITTLPDTKTTQTTYQDWNYTAIDQNGHAKLYTQDAYGRTASVTEYTGTTSPYTTYALTQYAYNVADQLLTVTDNATNLTTITYDLLGQKITMTDPDMGYWQYAYDPVGTLQSQTDAKSQTTTFAYDTLKRLVRKWYPVVWTQETITAGVSRPTVYDLMELRNAVDANRAAAGLATGGFTDPAIQAGTGIPIKAVQFTDLRNAIQGLWTAAGLGSVPQFTAGAIAAHTRAIKASDPTDLRGWLVQYENSTYGATYRARTAMSYDAYNGTTQFGRGKRTALFDSAGSQFWTFDQAGRLTIDDRYIDGYEYKTQYSFDAMDRTYQMTYPDSEVLTYSYAANALLSQIASSLGVNYVSGAQYNAFNLPTQYTLGSGTTGLVTNTYYGIDAGTYPYGALKTSILQQGTNPKLVDRSLVYDLVGNPTAITDNVNSETISYSFDDLDRLLTASAPVSETYVYNQIGNITSKNAVTYSYDPSHKHAVSSYNGTSYLYDANGCMTTHGSQTIKYDTENRPVRVDAGVTISKFSYDGDGTRRKRLDANGTIHYAGSYEHNLGTNQAVQDTVTKYYTASLGGTIRLVAFRKGGVLSYVGTDHLGGTIRVTNASFTALDQMRYRPFGVSRDAGTSLNTDHQFTFQVNDLATGLYWYGSRSYDPALGRMCQPDSLVPTAGNPQALNRYGYVLNNPLTFVDPSGHDPQGWIDDAWKAEFRQVHKTDPGLGDYVYRMVTMSIATGSYASGCLQQRTTVGVPQGQGPDTQSQTDATSISPAPGASALSILGGWPTATYTTTLTFNPTRDGIHLDLTIRQTYASDPNIQIRPEVSVSSINLADQRTITTLGPDYWKGSTGDTVRSTTSGGALFSVDVNLGHDQAPFVVQVNLHPYAPVGVAAIDATNGDALGSNGWGDPVFNLIQ